MNEMNNTKLNQEVVLEANDIVKTFGPVTALNHVSIKLRKGEILGLIGENGSGKSTITSIIAGMQKCDSGTMVFKGQEWNPQSMIEASDGGIGMIVQETGTIANISVAENIFLGETKQFASLGLINKRRMNREADRILESIGCTHIKGYMPTYMIDFQDRKLIEIAKVMKKNPDIIVVDETTTALSQQGRDIIYNIMEKMKNEGKSVFFISHDLDELLDKCDTLTVLRDGNYIATLEHDEFDADKIKQYMVGRELSGDYYRSDYDPSTLDEVALELKDATADGINDLNITLHKGEILGIGGLSHCGMHKLGKVLFGSIKLNKGSYLVHGNKIKDEAAAMKEGIGYVSKDRDTESLNLNASILDNISIAGMDKFAIKNFLLLRKNENSYVDKEVKDLSIKCFDKFQDVSHLSGGNKQKVVFGKWVGRESEILILDCPTRGVDIGVKQFMYQLMYSLKKEGKSIVLISEEMAELIGMSDRLLIMKDGRITKEFERSADLTDSKVIDYMI